MPTKRRILWKRLEFEYGVPIKEILEDLLFNPYAPLTYSDASAVLEVHRNTLLAWRKALNIPDRPTVRYTLSEKFVDKQVQKRGYSDIRDAVRDLKLNKGMSTKRISKFLGVSERSVRVYTPKELRK